MNKFSFLSRIHFQARTIDFDVNFLNFEDPEVLQRMVGPEYKLYWKTTFGVDWVHQQGLIGEYALKKTRYLV
jgi:ribosomal protein S18